MASLRTGHLNQDPLENHFGLTCLSPSNGNCATDFDSILATVGTYCQNVVIDTAEIPEEKESAESLTIVEADYQQLLEEKNLVNKNAIHYVTGYLAKKCLQKHQCETCNKGLVNNVLDSPEKLFTYFKSFEETDKPFGKLTAPADNLVKYVQPLMPNLLKHFQL